MGYCGDKPIPPNDRCCPLINHQIGRFLRVICLDTDGRVEQDLREGLPDGLISRAEGQTLRWRNLGRTQLLSWWWSHPQSSAVHHGRPVGFRGCQSAFAEIGRSCQET